MEILAIIVQKAMKINNNVKCSSYVGWHVLRNISIYDPSNA